MPSPAQVRWAKFRVTLVAISALAILTVLIYLLTGGTLFQEKALLFVYVPDAIGISEDTAVRVNGINIGKVRRVELSGSNDPKRVVRLTIEVRRNDLVDVPTDSFAQISADSALGNQFVDITRGTSAIRVRPNAEIAYKPQPELLQTADIKQVEERLRAVDSLLDDIEQGKNPVGLLLETDTLYNDLRTRVAGLERIVTEAASTTNTVGQLTYTDQLYRQFREPFLQLDSILSGLQSGQGGSGSLLREDGQYLQLRDQLANWQQMLTGLRSDPLLQSDELYTSWSRAIDSLIETVDNVSTNRWLVTSDDYDTWNGAARELRDSLRDFRSNPRKYLRLDLAAGGSSHANHPR